MGGHLDRTSFQGKLFIYLKYLLTSDKPSIAAQNDLQAGQQGSKN